MSIDLSYEQPEKPRFSIMSIDDNTNPRNAMCGNLTGMCCNRHILGQQEILNKVEDAYAQKQLEKSTSKDVNASESALSSYRNVSTNRQPLMM